MLIDSDEKTKPLAAQSHVLGAVLCVSNLKVAMSHLALPDCGSLDTKRILSFVGDVMVHAHSLT